ncbi:hypothetical protein SAY87_022263 [Trapa incisa]|uniref:Uncharacterized protein n=1 Tax=Trapa incisa TaxID=236973 RepID=A0AAN7JS33_9MYRT|nr:hypothetical protein SAY87_022263 [Trapa incisa]
MCSSWIGRRKLDHLRTLDGYGIGTGTIFFHLLPSFPRILVSRQAVRIGRRREAEEPTQLKKLIFLLRVSGNPVQLHPSCFYSSPYVCHFSDYSLFLFLH